MLAVSGSSLSHLQLVLAATEVLESFHGFKSRFFMRRRTQDCGPVIQLPLTPSTLILVLSRVFGPCVAFVFLKIVEESNSQSAGGSVVDQIYR